MYQPSSSVSPPHVREFYHTPGLPGMSFPASALDGRTVKMELSASCILLAVPPLWPLAE